MSVLRDIDSEHGAEAIAIFPYEDLRGTGLNLPVRVDVEVSSFQF